MQRFFTMPRTACVAFALWCEGSLAAMFLLAAFSVGDQIAMGIGPWNV
jgi:hypothetical protein